MFDRDNMNLMHTVGAAIGIRTLLYAAPYFMNHTPEVEPLPYVALAAVSSSIYLQITTNGPWNRGKIIATTLNIAAAGTAVAMIFLRNFTPEQSHQGRSLSH
jgi:hypothetical protein